MDPSVAPVSLNLLCKSSARGEGEGATQRETAGQCPLSDASLRSEWVRTELRRAGGRRNARTGGSSFPITLIPFDPAIREWECFDADSGKGLGVEVREYFIPDFSNWKDHDAFESAFARLLRDLRAEENQRP